MQQNCKDILQQLIDQALQDEANRKRRSEERSQALASLLQSMSRNGNVNGKEESWTYVVGAPSPSAIARETSLPLYESLVRPHDRKFEILNRDCELDLESGGRTMTRNTTVENSLASSGTTPEVQRYSTSNALHHHPEVLVFSPPPRSNGMNKPAPMPKIAEKPATGHQNKRSTTPNPQTYGTSNGHRKITAAEANLASLRPTKTLATAFYVGKAMSKTSHLSAVSSSVKDIPVHVLTLGTHNSRQTDAKQQARNEGVPSNEMQRRRKDALVIVDIKDTNNTIAAHDDMTYPLNPINVPRSTLNLDEIGSRDRTGVSMTRSPSYPSQSPSEMIEMKMREDLQNQHRALRFNHNRNQPYIKSVSHSQEVSHFVRQNNIIFRSPTIKHQEVSSGGPKSNRLGNDRDVPYSRLERTSKQHTDAYYGIFGDDEESLGTQAVDKEGNPNHSANGPQAKPSVDSWLRDTFHAVETPSSNKFQAVSMNTTNTHNSSHDRSALARPVPYMTPVKVAALRHEGGLLSPKPLPLS